MDNLGINLPVLVSAGLLLLGAIARGVFSIINKRSDAKSRVQPTVEQIWARLDRVETSLDKERTLRQRAEELVRNLRDVFLDYVDRVQDGGSNSLTEEERHLLEQTKES